MDETKEYFWMCFEAKEIQEVWEIEGDEG